MITDREGASLARYARACIAASLGGPTPEAPQFDGVGDPGATFVTLRRDGALHGCIGTIEPRRSLVDDVRSNAVSAALFDPRAAPLSLGEVDDLDVEVSLLSALEPVPCRTEAEAIAALRPGVDGVVFRSGGRRATYLPQVWENLPDPRDFLASLKLKAGLSSRHWSDDVEVLRYSVRKFEDHHSTNDRGAPSARATSRSSAS